MRIVNFLTEDKWTRGCMAEDENGHPVQSQAVEACRWCISGAIELCYPDWYENSAVRDRVVEYVNSIGDLSCDPGEWVSISTWNDHLATWPAVKKMLERLQV